jgi:hypothetical protein
MDPVMGSQNSLYDLLHHLNVLPSAVLMTAELIKTEKCLIMLLVEIILQNAPES